MDLSCIIGMHRSGTSLASRVANLLGADLGPAEELMEARPDNPTGFWESKPVARLNEEILGVLGGSWDRPPPLPEGWQHDERLDGLRARAAALLDDRFDPSGTATWKDPRASLTLPLWRDMVGALRAVICVRDPNEVGRSLLRRNGITAERAARLWLRYVLAAVRHAPEADVVFYADFFDDLDGTVSRLAAALALPAPGPEVLDEVRAFFDPGLRHHRSTSAEGTPAVALAGEVFAALRAGALAPATAAAIERGLQQEQRLDELEQQVRVLHPLERVVEQLRAELERAAEVLDAERRASHERVARSIALADQAVRSADALRAELGRAQRASQVSAREVEAAVSDRRLLRQRLEEVTQERDAARSALAERPSGTAAGGFPSRRLRRVE